MIISIYESGNWSSTGLFHLGLSCSFDARAGRWHSKCGPKWSKASGKMWKTGGAISTKLWPKLWPKRLGNSERFVWSQGVVSQREKVEVSMDHQVALPPSPAVLSKRTLPLAWVHWPPGPKNKKLHVCCLKLCGAIPLLWKWVTPCSCKLHSFIIFPVYKLGSPPFLDHQPLVISPSCWNIAWVKHWNPGDTGHGVSKSGHLVPLNVHHA